VERMILLMILHKLIYGAI